MLYSLYIPFLWCGPLLRVSGDVRIGIGIEVFATVTAVLLMFVLIPQYGALGGAIAFVTRVILYSATAGTYLSLRKARYFG